MTITGSLADAVAVAGVLPGTLRQWVRRGHIPPPANGVWDLLAIVRYVDGRASYDHNRAVAGRFRRGVGVSLVDASA